MDFLLLLPLLSVCLLSCSGTTSGETVVRVEEGSDAVLPCLIRPERDITQVDFDWRKVVQMKNDKLNVFHYKKGLHYNNGLAGQDEQFEGRVSHFPEQLQSGNASIKITNSKLSDGGTYTCEFSPGQSNSQMFTIELVVGACSEPYAIPLKDTKYWALLQCEARRAFPKPKLEWQDSDGNVLPAGEPEVTQRDGRFYVTLQTNVTKTGDYNCVATQLEICHQIPAKISVYIPGPDPPRESTTGWIVGTAVFGTLFFVGVFVLVVLVAKGCIKLDCMKGSQTKTERNEQGEPLNHTNHSTN